MKGDAELLERHLGDDLSFTHAGGMTETKSEWVLRARRIPSRYFFARDVSNQVVEIHGDVALVVGRLDIRGFGPREDPTKTPPNCSAIEYVHLFKRTVETVRADGSRDTRAYTAKYDGKDYSDIGPHFDTVALTRIDAWTVDEAIKKAGRLVYTARQVVSKDGRIITTTVTGTNASGQPMHNVRVLDKQ